MQPRSSMATVLPASSPGPRGPCCWVIPSARCATSGSTRNGRRVGFSTTPPRQKPAGDISPAAGASRHHHQPWARCAPGRSPARDPWRSGGDGREGGPDPRAHRPGLRQPSGAEPSERASEPSPTRWSPGQPSSSSALGPAPRPLQPRRPAPTVGAPSLLELLDLLQAQPRALVDAEVAQHLLHRLCVSVLHGCGGPGRPRLASPRPPPRLRLALGPRARATAGARARTAVSPPLSPPPPPLLLLGRCRRRFRLTGR